MQSVFAKKTVILVTHKTSLLKLVDRLIVMDRGQIVTQGEKQEVIRQLQANSVSEAQHSHA